MPKIRTIFVALATVAGVCLLTLHAANAASSVCPPTFKLWTATAGSGLASPPVTDTVFSPVPGRSRSYVTQGSQLLTYYNVDSPAGCTPGTGNACAPSGGTCTRLKGCQLTPWTPPTQTVLGAPTFARSSQNPLQAYIFVGAQDGQLYRLDVSGEPPYPMISVDTRRASCPLDQVVSAPSVQAYVLANSAFRAEVDLHPGHAQDDVVFVVTRTGCGDQTRNRVIAYWASDLTVKWVFNAPRLAGDETGPIRMGPGTSGILLDSDGNRLFLGTDAPAVSTQDSLWAIRSITGELIWSDKPGGAVLNRPTLNTNNNRLYVVNRAGVLWAYDAAGNGSGGPAKLWPTGLEVGVPTVQRSPWVEPRPGTWQDKILTLDSTGTLRGIQDDGAVGRLLWVASSPDPSRWVSTPVVLPGATESKAFIGRTDGYLQMIKLDGGQPEGILQITTSATDVFDPVLDTDPGSAVPNRLVVVGGTTMARVSVPTCALPPALPVIACNCTDGKVCGAGVPGDPFRCCDVSKDSCMASVLNNPCKPLRCAVKPSCCALYGSSCISDANCGGRPGSCDLDLGVCTSPCGPPIDAACVGPGQTCGYFLGVANQVPDSTPCDDRQVCTTAQPPPILVDCVPGIDASACTKDRSASDLVDDNGDCPLAAPICSGSSVSGQGGPITNGLCCPQGTACDPATSKCRGNFGTAGAANDVCRNGACSSDNYSSCICDIPGERACAPEFDTCCASGCKHLSSDPRNCGACGNDCGANICTAGVCTSGAACTGPDLDDLVAASQIPGMKGMCSLDFDSANGFCSAYVTNYRTDGGPAIAVIDQNGATTGYTSNPPDPARLNGVAVNRDGSDVFAAMVNEVVGIPGMALRGPGASTYARAKTAMSTGGLDDAPFDQAAFNSGPVGPAYDDVTDTSLTSRKVWFGNFKCPAVPTDGTCTCLDNGLCKLDFSNGTNWSATPETYCNQFCGAGICDYAAGAPCEGRSERITALAFAPRTVAPATVSHRHLVVAHRTILSFVDLDGGTPRQRDVNLASPNVANPNASRGESTVAAILSIAPVPYGDVVVEVRGAGDMPAPGNVANTWLLNVNVHDRSVRHELEVQRDLKHVNRCAGSPPLCPNGYSCFDDACLKTCGSCPGGFTCSNGLCHLEEEVPPNFGIGAGLNAGNGRLGMLPSGKLLRWVAAVDQVPASMTEYDLTPLLPANCEDANLCTVDAYIPATGQCTHSPVSCDDFDQCTVDTCSAASGCAHGALDCNDNNACTADTCSAASGCLHAPIGLAEPSPVQFTSNAVMQWPATPDASHWNTYRGTIPAGSLGSRLPGSVYDQTCYESGDALGDGPTKSTDTTDPLVGTGFYYLVSGEAGCESNIGHASSGAAIPNTSPCPTPP